MKPSESDNLFYRLRTLACREWSVAPPVLDGMIDRGEISMLDIISLVHMLAHDPLVGFWVVDYLYPNLPEKRKKQKAQKTNDETFLKMLSMVPTRNEAEAKKKSALIEAMTKKNA